MPDVAAEILRLADALESEGRGALEDALTATHLYAQVLSSGMETRQDHARKGHPYARRHGRVTGSDPVLINALSGRFLFAWQTEGPQVDGDGLTGAVFNTDPKAEWLHRGTRSMLGRPVPEYAAMEGEEVLVRSLTRRLNSLF